jgi:hypothetical protein
MDKVCPLGDFYANAKPKPTIPVETVDVSFESFSSSRFDDAARRIDNMNPQQCFDMVKENLDVIVSRTLQDDRKIGDFLINPRFINAYTQIMRQIPITDSLILFANKLTYDYSLLDNYVVETYETFRGISDYVSDFCIRKLMSIGLDRETACSLAVARYASVHESTNVQRLNFEMGKYYVELMTEQMIVWIYEQLFDKISDLFISSMLEVYTDQELDTISHDFRDIYGNISLAILDILNNMPAISIRQVILKYIDAYEEWNKVHHDLPRFSINRLSYDYERILNVVERLEREGYVMP